MNPVLSVSPTRYSGSSETRFGHGRLHFGNGPDQTDPAQPSREAEAKKSVLGSLVDEIKRFFRDILDSLFGRFRNVLAAGGSALGTLGESIAWVRALGDASPGSSFEDKAKAIGSLTHAAFHESLVRHQADEDGPVQDPLLYDLYAHVIREFPGLLKDVKNQPKIGEVSLLSRLVHAHPDYDASQANGIEDRVRNHPEAIKAMDAEALSGFAEALIAGDTAEMDRRLKPPAPEPGDDSQ